MNSKIIIVRMINSLTAAINYLGQSLRDGGERFYVVNQDDTPIVSANNGLQCLVAFVVFQPDTEHQQDKILKLYVGSGQIVQRPERWIIEYKINAEFTSDMIINNFVSNSELDLKNDFKSHSFVMIEDNIELVRQISFITFPLYHHTTISPENQDYNKSNRDSLLHEYSQYNEHCKRPIGIRHTQENRSEFQRDYERIIHARAYRRLVDKAQIFTSSKGDHYRTRMTHTLEVAQIARAIAIGLKLNVELTESIALAHDLGHTPFGHQGERTLDKILKGKIDIIQYTPDKHNFYGGFKHNFQGIRVADCLEEKYVEYDGLDLSYQVLEGILKHTSVKIKHCDDCVNRDHCDENCFELEEFMKHGKAEYLYPKIPFATTLEGQIVAISDEIAQRSHDLDDAFTSGIMSIHQLYNYLQLQKASKLNEYLETIEKKFNEATSLHHEYVDEDELKHSRIVSEVIHFFIKDTIQQSQQNINNFVPNEFYCTKHRFDKKLITFSDEGAFLCNYLEKIISKKVINNPEVVRFDSMAATIVEKLFSAYYNNPRLLHKGTLRKIYIETRQSTNEIIDFINGDRSEVDKEIKKIVATDLEEMDISERKIYAVKKKILVRAIADYISGMTDSYAINEYHLLYP